MTLTKFTLCALFFLLIGAKQGTDLSLCHAEQKNGLYVFYLSKPVSKYEYLGTIKLSVTWSEKMSEKLEMLLKKAKKEYNSANAIIVQDLDGNKADCIKLNE
jgi:hypothetical protein